VDGGENLIVRNTAQGNTTADYDISFGNNAAAILSPGAAFVSTQPWTNFTR
jgi:hypothetical protein